MSNTTRTTRRLSEVWADRARDAFQDSRLTLQQLGVGMGYPDDAARLTAWHFLYRTPDPPLSEVRQFAKAVGVPLKVLVA